MAIVTVICVLLATTLLYAMQRRAIFPLGYGSSATPTAPAGFESIRVPTPSGNLLVWIRPGARDRPVLLFLHGNAAGIDSTAYVTETFAKNGWTIVVPEYPGYPGNAGTPSQQGLLDAARSGWRTALRGGRSSNDVVILGNSIGSGPAIALAAETHPRGLVVVSGIASLPQVVRTRLAFIPDMLVRDRFYNAQAMRRVTSPVMVVHGTSDDVVPVSQGASLARAANARLETVPGGHEIIALPAVQKAVLARFSAR